MSEDDLFDKLRGRKYIYLVAAGADGNANIVAYSVEQAITLAQQLWWPEIATCVDVTEQFHTLNNALTPEDLEKLEPGLLRIGFTAQHNYDKWTTTR